MTRFARAKGPVAANRPEPEEATSWSEMKQQLLEKNQESEDRKKRKEADQQREKNYKAFLEEVEDEKSKNVQWADFSEESTKPKKKGKKIKQNPDDDAPEECSAKVEQPEIKIVKKKEKKKKLKIVVNDSAQVKRFDEEQVKQTEVNNSSEQEVKVSKKKKSKSERAQGVKRKAPEEVEAPAPNKKSKKGDNKSKLPKKKEPTEDDLKKIEKKRQKRLKQLERKKLKKAELLKQKESESSTSGVAPKNREVKQQPPIKKFDKPINQQNNPKKPKLTNGEKPERRKELKDKMMIGDREVELSYIDGYPIKKEDAERIYQLRKQMISKGLPRSEIKIALKLERRKAEKALTRERKKVCFNCRKSGHSLSECPNLGKDQMVESAGTGICFKCGSTEHTHFECKVVRGEQFKFAQCFICHQQGHIAKQCPDNPRGLYPRGGGCNECGDVTHFKKDCPAYREKQQQEENRVQVGTLDERNPDSLEQESEEKVKSVKKTNKVIKF